MTALRTAEAFSFLEPFLANVNLAKRGQTPCLSNTYSVFSLSWLKHVWFEITDLFAAAIP